MLIRKAPTRTYRAASKVEDAIGGTFLNAVDVLRDTAGSIERLGTDAFQWRLFERELQTVQPSFLKAAAQAARSEVRNAAWGKHVVLKQGVELDLMNSYSVRAAERQAADLVALVSFETRLAIRRIIARAQAEGLTVEEQAALIREIVGLNSRQAIAVQNLRASLIEAGLAPDIIQQRVRQATERYVLQRARMIARHESLRAANAGQDAIWKVARDNGLVPQDQLRQWITAGDDRVCPICRPMNGQTRRIGESFLSPYNGATAEYPPVHVACRCVLVLVVED